MDSDCQATYNEQLLTIVGLICDNLFLVQNDKVKYTHKWLKLTYVSNNLVFISNIFLYQFKVVNALYLCLLKI